MGQAITITRTEHTAEALREFAAKSRDGAQVRRLLAIALIQEGRSRTEAAELSGMDRQTLRDWVHRYNAEGIAGLATSRRSPGRPPFLSPGQMAELKEPVIRGPDPEKDQVVRWRCLDLQGEVAERFSVTVHERIGNRGKTLNPVVTDARSTSARWSTGCCTSSTPVVSGERSSGT